MAGTVFGRLSLEEGDSANSLEGLDNKLGAEGKTTSGYLLRVWGKQLYCRREDVQAIERRGKVCGITVWLETQPAIMCMLCCFWICIGPMCDVLVSSSRAWWRWAEADQRGRRGVPDLWWLRRTAFLDFKLLIQHPLPIINFRKGNTQNINSDINEVQWLYLLIWWCGGDHTVNPLHNSVRVD